MAGTGASRRARGLPANLPARVLEQEYMLTKWRSMMPALLLLILPIVSLAQEGDDISANVAPPDLPVYEQPPIPGDGYLWTPGYWAWSDDDQDYYWVPGTWVLVPQPGYLWTPGYWSSAGGVFYWHAGYWGPLIGFYGGVAYGYGYVGRGFEGGYWQSGRLYYNQSVVNVGTTHITNVYNSAVVNNVTINRVSYNGGSDGVQAQPTAAETSAAQARHLPPTAAQQQQIQLARSNPALRASANHGNPPIAATARPGVFTGAGVVAAKHPGTMSVVHAPAPPYTAPPPHAAAAPQPPAPAHAAAPAHPPPPYSAAPRPAPQEAHPAPPKEAPPRPPSRPADHPTEHDHD